MTTIVTTTSSQFASIFADEGITSDLIHPDMRKITRQGTWLIAACGEDRVCDVVQYVVKYPAVPQTLKKKPSTEWYGWMATMVIPKISAAIEKTMPKAYKNSIGDSELILITHGRSFLIGDTLGVTLAEPYWAIGSGSHMAIGSIVDLSKSVKWEDRHHEFAKRAVLVAQKHDPYTRGKVTGYASYRDGTIEELNG